MKHHIAFLLFLGLAALLTTTEAKKKLRRPGSRQRDLPVPDTSAYIENDLDLQLNEIETSDDLNQGNFEPPKYFDPCKKRRCSAGQTCKLTEDGEPICICITDCPKEIDPRRKVCSNLNDTWDSDCELNQMRCWCEGNDPRCRDDKLAHHHINYFGPCTEIKECTEGEMQDFPRRMRDWLFHVMQDMADREELSPYYSKMERKAESNYTRRWNAAAVWKWCDLDVGHDRSVSIHELFPIRAPLMAMEHCIRPFLDSCDANDDHKITLQEWFDCLELGEASFEEGCEIIREGENF